MLSAHPPKYVSKQQAPYGYDTRTMVADTGSAVTSGVSPVDFLTRAGTPGYVALARQVGIWARM